jgi:ABC-2 type transport system ATP-binding protein
MTELLSEQAARGETVLFSSHQLDLVEDLCQDVVIIEHGRIVLAGDLNDLRATVPRRFIDIRYQGPPPDWDRLAPAALIEDSDGHARLQVERGIDMAALLAALPGGGAGLVSFTYQPPTLPELFREAVAA